MPSAREPENICCATRGHECLWKGSPLVTGLEVGREVWNHVIHRDTTIVVILCNICNAMWINVIYIDIQQSRKLASASWSPFCFSNLGGLESPIAWNFMLNPPRLAGSQAVWPWLNPPPGTPSACRHRQQMRQHLHPQHSPCFHAQLPAKLAFVPYSLASSPM